MRFKFYILKTYLVALILLAAILSGVFSFVLLQSKAHSSATKVYCPLTKRLQPINPPQENAAPVFSLNEICANDSEKNRLESAIVENFKLKFSRFTQKSLENLAFDFWQKGERAFDALPNIPNAPEKLAVKNTLQTTGFNKRSEIKIALKTIEKFAFPTLLRPPPAQNFPAFKLSSVLKLPHISSRIAPRAPPVSV